MFYGLPFIHSDRDPAFQKRQQSSRSDPIVFLKAILPDVTLKHRQMLRFAKTPDHVADIKIDISLHLPVSKESMPSSPFPVYYTPSIAIEYGSPTHSTGGF
jgi:hypothetical protein